MPRPAPFSWLLVGGLLLPHPAPALTNPGEVGEQAWAFRNEWVRNPSLNRLFKATVYYPGVSQGQAQDLDLDGTPYASVVFGHGFSMNRSRYDFYGQHLATHGYVVVLMNFKDLFTQNQVSDMRACLDWLEDQNADPSSWLSGALDIDMMGVSGHSMGGGVSLAATAVDPRIDACVPLAPVVETAALEAALAPTILLGGDRDGIIPLKDMRDPWLAAAIPPTEFITIWGANHNQFMDVSYFWEDLLDGVPTITRSEQQRIANFYSTAAYGYYLKGIGAYRSYLFGNRGAADVTVRLEYESGETIDLVAHPDTASVPLGGSITVHAEIREGLGESRRISARTVGRRDGVSLIDPLLGPIQVTLDAGATRNLDWDQEVPPRVPVGNYDYAVIVTDGEMEIEDSFAVTVHP